MGGPNSGRYARSTRLRESQAIRFDALKWQEQAKAEFWPDGIRQALAYRAPHTGAIVSARVEMVFTDQPFGGRRLWFRCPECPRDVRYLYGGRPRPTERHRIACYVCQRVLRESDRDGTATPRRWRRQIAKIERRLRGHPRKLTPPKHALARKTFDRLAARHAFYMAKITAHAQERFRQRLRNRPWPTDPTEMRALREACGLPGITT
jgi:hypothetical protein